MENVRHGLAALRGGDKIVKNEEPTSGLEPLTPAPATGDNSCVAGVCTRLQIPHFQAAFSAPGCPMLHRFAFLVVSDITLVFA